MEIMTNPSTPIKIFEKSRFINNSLPVFAFVLSFIFIGCGHMRTAVHSNWVDHPAPIVAIIPPVGDDVFSGPIFGDRIADALVTELVNKGFTVMERTRLDQIIKEHRLQYTGAFDPQYLIAMGKLSGVDAIIIGSLTTRTTVSAFEYFLGDGIGDVQIDTVRMRWVNVNTGQIMASSLVKNSRGGTPEKIARKMVRGMDVKIKTLVQARVGQEEIQSSVQSTPEDHTYAFNVGR